MSPGTLTYLALLLAALVVTFRVGTTYQKTLRRRVDQGLVGLDPGLTERYARHPGQALRESAFTRGFVLVFRKQADPEVERARRAYALCVAATAAFAFFGLALL